MHSSPPQWLSSILPVACPHPWNQAGLEGRGEQTLSPFPGRPQALCVPQGTTGPVGSWRQDCSHSSVGMCLILPSAPLALGHLATPGGKSPPDPTGSNHHFHTSWHLPKNGFISVPDSTRGLGNAKIHWCFNRLVTGRAAPSLSSSRCSDGSSGCTAGKSAGSTSGFY